MIRKVKGVIVYVTRRRIIKKPQKCGRTEKHMICPKCGARLAQGSTICPICGTKIRPSKVKVQDNYEEQPDQGYDSDSDDDYEENLNDDYDYDEEDDSYGNDDYDNDDYEPARPKNKIVFLLLLLSQ